MTKSAWQQEKDFRDSAVPVDRRKAAASWEHVADFPHGDGLLRWHWNVRVPGSLAPDIFFMGMVQDWANQGYDVREAEALLPEGIQFEREGRIEELRVLSARIMQILKEAPKIPGHPYHQYEHPASWEEVRAAMPAAADNLPRPAWKDRYNEQIYQGWLGQMAGGSFGTAIEGYTGERIHQVYGEVRGYLIPPETTNDDVVYELLLMDVFERLGRKITSAALADEWVKKLPYGVSAEGTALRNINLGIYPPESGTFLNPYCDWIGAQMRGMICGMLSPADPMEAARLAHVDGVVSHARNGVYGEIYAAVITSLAFGMEDPREIILEGARYVPAGSEYAAQLAFCIETVKTAIDPQTAWKILEKHFERYNWIHAYPNLAADVLALWYGQGDFTESMALLASAGLDVDCNGGLVGNVLGILKPVPSVWADPLGDLLETYIAGKEKLSIRALAEKTVVLAQK